MNWNDKFGRGYRNSLVYRAICEQVDFDPICPRCGEPSGAQDELCQGCEHLESCFGEMPAMPEYANAIMSKMHGLSHA